MQIKAAVRHALIPVRIAKVNKGLDSTCWEVVEKEDPGSSLLGMQIGALPLQISQENLQPHDPATPLSALAQRIQLALETLAQQGSQLPSSQ